MQKLADGTVHKLPADFRRAIESNATAKKLWAEITPRARNEWICWITSAKQDATRQRRMVVGIEKTGRHAQAVLLAWVPALLKRAARRTLALMDQTPNTRLPCPQAKCR